MLMVPLIYVLASKKDAETYGTIFAELKKIKPTPDPKHIMIDFEQAAMREVGNIFPEAQIHACFFHFFQCIWRKIQQLGLAKKYGEEPEFALQMRYFAGLAFMPPANVIDSFKGLKEIMEMQARPKTNTSDFKVWQLFEYMEKAWVGRKGKLPKFPIAMWNMRQLTLDGQPRTNNAVEGWHNAIPRSIGCSNPTIWTFIDKIKCEQDRQKVRMAQAIGENGERMRKKYVDHSLNIFNSVKAHDRKPTDYTLKEFLSRLGHNLRY